MARTRSIRPGFFTNDSLGQLPAVVRLLFAGLWTVADREGRLLDRPRKLKAELLAYDKIDVDKALDRLAAAGFIARYTVNGGHYLKVNNWSRHQRPHPREEESVLPAPESDAFDLNGGAPGLTPEEDPGAPAIAAESLPNPPGTLSSSSWSLSSSSGSYHSLRENPPTPLDENDLEGEPRTDPEDDAATGAETCPECSMLVGRDGTGHGLSQLPGRLRNCSLDHVPPQDWPVPAEVSS